MSPTNAYLAGIEAGSSVARDYTRGDAVLIVALLVGMAACFVAMTIMQTHDYLRDSGLLVSERGCQPFVGRELDRLMRWLDEQQPRGYAALREQDVR